MSVTNILYRLIEPPGDIFLPFTFDNLGHTENYIVGMTLHADDEFAALQRISARYHLAPYFYFQEISNLIPHGQDIRASDQGLCGIAHN